MLQCAPCHIFLFFCKHIFVVSVYGRISTLFSPSVDHTADCELIRPTDLESNIYRISAYLFCLLFVNRISGHFFPIFSKHFFCVRFFSLIVTLLVYCFFIFWCPLNYFLHKWSPNHQRQILFHYILMHISLHLLLPELFAKMCVLKLNYHKRSIIHNFVQICEREWIKRSK